MAISTASPDPHLGQRQDGTSSAAATTSSISVSAYATTGIVTSGSSLTTAAAQAATYVLTINRRGLTAASLVNADATVASAGAGTAYVQKIVPATDSVAI